MTGLATGLFNGRSQMVTIQTGPLCGHAVQFSPFTGNQLAFAGAENYGIAGKPLQLLINQKIKTPVCLLAGTGACVIFERDPSGAWHQIKECVSIFLATYTCL